MSLWSNRMAGKRKINSKLSKVMNDETILTTKNRFIPTLEDSLYWIKTINDELFKGRLPDFHEIEIRRRHGCWAECMVYITDCGETHKYVLSLNHRMNSKKHFIQILAHEMVHLWQFMNYGSMDHGESFKSWKETFQEHDILLRIDRY